MERSKLNESRDDRGEVRINVNLLTLLLIALVVLIFLWWVMTGPLFGIYTSGLGGPLSPSAPSPHHDTSTNNPQPRPMTWAPALQGKSG